MKKLYFGTAGVPISAKRDDSKEGVRRISELGLDAMELEFVQGVRLSLEGAEAIDELRKKLDVKLTAHGPYYINLNAVEPHKVIASRNHILSAARVGWRAGAVGVVFHAAFYLKQPADKVYRRVKKELKGLVKSLRAEDNEILLRPETTGKGSQFGTLQELIKMSEDVPGVMPCLDFSHMHARQNGGLGFEDFKTMLSDLEAALGRTSLDNIHIHLSGIEYTEKGERRHTTLEDSDFLYEDVLKALKEFDVKGIVICESPILEDDAIVLKEFYEGL
ncbi:MAG: TIM barrel protein [Thermoplasmata archaeon]|nr:MAG: TIM barrel protein [Thermoplasmata archaeon]